jgi:hypothetical protein
MELQQVMEIRAERKTTQQKTDVKLKEMNAKMDGRQEEMKGQMTSLTSRLDANREEMKTTQAEIKEDIKANQAKTNANREEMVAMMEATVNSHQEKMDAWIAEMKDGRKKGTMACQEATGAYPEKGETSPEEVESGAEQQEVLKEYAAVKPAGGLRKRRGGLNLAAERRQEPEERTRRNCGSRKKLATSGRKMACRARVTSSARVRRGKSLQEEPLKDGRSGRNVGRNRE